MHPTTAPPQPQNTDAEQKRRAVEVGTHFKKVIDAYRMFDPGHETLQVVESALWGKTGSYLESFGDLSFELSATTISIEGKDVITATKSEDSISFPLFAEGVHEILISNGLESDELFRFLQIWSSSMRRGSTDAGEVNLLTLFWEADFQSIELVAMETTLEGGGDEETDEETRKKTAELRKIMKAVAGDLPDFGVGMESTAVSNDFWTLSAETKGNLRQGVQLAVDDANAVQILAHECHVAMSPDDVMAPPPPFTSPLTDADLVYIRQQIEDGWEKEVVERFVRAVYGLAADAPDQERVALARPLAQVLAAMAEGSHFGEMANLLKSAQQDGLAAAANPNHAYQAFDRLRAAMEGDDVLIPVIDALEFPQHVEAAARLLGMTRVEAAPALIGALDRLSGHVAIEQLISIISTRNPPAQALADAAQASKPEVARGLLRAMEGRPSDEAQLVRRAILLHTDRGLRKQMLGHLTPEQARESANEVRHLIGDPDERIREISMVLSVQNHDVAAVPKLSQLLDGEYAKDEKRKAATALGRMQTTEAGISLRKAFLQLKDPEVRSACALALAEMGDMASKPMLEKEAGRFLNRGGLKAACIEALRRLEARERGPQKR